MSWSKVVAELDKLIESQLPLNETEPNKIENIDDVKFRAKRDFVMLMTQIELITYEIQLAKRDLTLRLGTIMVVGFIIAAYILKWN